MSEPTTSERVPNLTRVALTGLGRKPHACPDQVKASWARLKATHKSVSGLFDTLHVLREKSVGARDDARGRLSEDQLDQIRAAIMFTSAGLDACLRRLLRDALPALIEGGGKPQGEFKGHVITTRLAGTLSRETKNAITDLDPRTRLIDLYVEDLAGSSLQGHTDLIRVRDALGLTNVALTDEHLEALKDFFAARNEIAHELDLLDPTGRGDRGRRHRDMAVVGDQCDRVIHVIEDFLRATAGASKTL